MKIYENSKENFDVYLALCTVKIFPFRELNNEMNFFARLTH